MNFVRSFSKCSVCPYQNKNKVWGIGNPKSKIIILGEAPGEEEDKSGIPFVGKAGKLLDIIIQDIIGKSRDEIWIMNYISCRPENNDFSSMDCCSAKGCCKFGLWEELDFLRDSRKGEPATLFSLGTNASSAFDLGKIGNIRGEYFYRRNWELYVYPIYHPSYLIRNGITEACDKLLWKIWEEDFRRGLDMNLISL